jgi:hypothetical protein
MVHAISMWNKMSARSLRIALIGTTTLLATITIVKLAAAAPLTMTVAPYLAFAPADLRVRVDVPRSPQNRTLVIVAESDEFYRSSEMPLEGEDAPRVIEVQFRSLPNGQYLVLGETRDQNGRTLAAVRQDVRVLSMAGSR